MKKAKPFPFTQDYLKNILHYNKKTGVFTWKYNPNYPAGWNTKFSGTTAGNLDTDGYIIISIKQKPYKAHRLAWFYVHGEQPSEVDHEDTIKDHNWLDNLRSANRNQNNHNVGLRKDNTSGFKGVWRNGNKYQAGIMIAGKRIHLGLYATPEAASEARNLAAKKYQKICSQHFCM